MQGNLTSTKTRTAILVLDYQNQFVAAVDPDQRYQLLENAKRAIKASRCAGLPVMYVVVKFREGYPEITTKNKLFREHKEAGRLLEGTPEMEIHPELAPQPGELIFTKKRVQPFSTTDILTVLKAKEIDTLVIFGLATSGAVLSTVRWAADLDFQLVVISDACAEPDAVTRGPTGCGKEVHQVLMERIFPRQATVLTTDDFVRHLAN